MNERRVFILLITMIVLRSSSFCSINAFALPRRKAAVTHYCRRSLQCSSRLSLHSSTLNQSLNTGPFEECWNLNTWSVNPLNDTRVDTILQRLCSPAPQSLFVLERALFQQQKSNTLEHVLSQCTYLLKPGFEFQVKEDVWRIESCQNSDSKDWISVKQSHDTMNAVELAHKALDIRIDGSENQFVVDEQELNNLVQEAKDRLSLTLGTDIRGRSSADAAFAFAMAGVTDKELFQYLALVARLELERIGQRPTFKSKYVLQMVEKLAAAGIKDEALFRVAASCLAVKGEHMDVVVETFGRPYEFDLLSTRPLLWLWRFSTRQRKVASDSAGRIVKEFVQQENDPSTCDWVHGFNDPSRPLVIDLGCGLGVSLLGLATIDQASQNSFNSSPEGGLLGDIDWRQCNYVGVDLSQLCLGYGRGVAERWGISGWLQFTYGSALDLLESVASHYPGQVTLIMIQFPTPYQLKDVGGNRQLPSDPESGFMVSENLLKACMRILKRSKGFLLLQSNCEDVAVTIRAMAESAARFDSVAVPLCVTDTSKSASSLRIPQRTLDWIQLRGKRAVGDGWSVTPLIPSRGATETEVSCRLNKTPIHRCLLQPGNTSRCD